MPVLARLCMVLAIALLPLGVSAKSKAPIRLAEGPSVSQKVVAAIAARALTLSGFKHEIVPLEDLDAVGALTDGVVHVHPSLPRDAAPDLGEALKAGTLTLLGGLESNDRDGAVLKVVSRRMKSKWPYAQKMLKRMVLSPDVVAGLVEDVEAGQSVDDAAAAWMKANRKIWKPWIAASRNWMKP